MSEPRRPLLIAGPTASGKSALALRIAQRDGGIIINADAMQVYSCWQILTARPEKQDLAIAPHHLFGHIGPDQPYSAGHWLRDVGEILATQPGRPIVVGGTGLYFTCLVNGLPEIPDIPSEVRDEGNGLRESFGGVEFAKYLAIHDPEVLARTDLNNPMRLQRAWEVHRATGRKLSDWQKNHSKPLINLDFAETIVLEAPSDWLNPRIEQRLDAMIGRGVLDECHRARTAGCTENSAAMRVLGAREFMACLDGAIGLPAAREKVLFATRQYAKRQRTWFRARMKDWRSLPADVHFP